MMKTLSLSRHQFICLLIELKIKQLLKLNYDAFNLFRSTILESF